MRVRFRDSFSPCCLHQPGLALPTHEPGEHGSQKAAGNSHEDQLVVGHSTGVGESPLSVPLPSGGLSSPPLSGGLSPPLMSDGLSSPPLSVGLSSPPLSVGLSPPLSGGLSSPPLSVGLSSPLSSDVDPLTSVDDPSQGCHMMRPPTSPLNIRTTIKMMTVRLIAGYCDDTSTNQLLPTRCDATN